MASDVIGTTYWARIHARDAVDGRCIHNVRSNMQAKAVEIRLAVTHAPAGKPSPDSTPADWRGRIIYI
jgi:hypothetical protein